MYAISNRQWREIIALLGAYAAEPSSDSTNAKDKRRRALLMVRKLAKKKMVRSPTTR